MSTIVPLQASDFENCDLKDHFATHSDALRRAKTIRKRGNGHRMSAYQCICGGWLLGHTHAEGAILAEPKYTDGGDPLWRARANEMTQPILATLFDSAYASKGLALIRSLQEHHADGFRLFVLALDDTTEREVSDLNDERVTVIPFPRILTTELVAALDGRSHEERCWTCTPFWVRYCLNTFEDVPHIAYVDADTYLLHPLHSLYREVRNASIAITPHRFSQARQRTHGVNGTYNVGWVYFRNDETARACLDEWANLCADWCYRRSERDEKGNLRYGDQGYFNFLVPKYGIHAVQNIGVGTAPWNAENYEYEVGAGAKAGESKRLFVIERNADGGVRRIDTLALFHMHAHEYDPRRRTFKRGGYALPPPIIEHVYSHYEKLIATITDELRRQPAYN